MSFRGDLLVLVACGAVAALAQNPSELPVTTAPGRAAELVRKWWREGTAAGNTGDFYDNRDRGHRRLDTKPYPQLSVVDYSAQDVGARRDYSAARTVRTNVVFGNSSTASNIEQGGGSNTRMVTSSQGGLVTLYAQYRGNNLFAYPEHLDHDPGRNGEGGYGDIFPINTPYVYTGQGSSGAEMEFLRALPLTLAAFRPDVKARLIRDGLLMPAVQMILRRTGKNAAEPADYLTGKAHPTVFDARNINVEAMVQLAQEITVESLPPLAQLQVVEEDFTRAGVDFFEAGATEKLGETPCAIGRIGRAVRFWRRMVVSAESSIDANARPLTWRWVVLRGDTNRVRIKPLNARGSIVELEVAYHERRPIAPGSDMESSRVDIGCFVNNGAHWSPPAFVCFYFLESEARGYEMDGRLVDVGYMAGEMRIEVTNWGRLFDLAASDSPGGKFLKERLTAEQSEAFIKPAAGYHALRVAQEEAIAEEKREIDAWYVVNRRFEEARKAGSSSAAAKEALDAVTAQKRVADERKRVAVEKTKSAGGALTEHLAPARTALMAFIESCRTNYDFVFEEKKSLQRLFETAGRPARAELEAEKNAMAQYGFMSAGKGLDVKLTPARGEPTKPLSAMLTPFEKILMERLNCEILGALLFHGMVQAGFREHFVAPLLTARKDWRDVYRYDPAGKMIGWTRYGPGQPPAEFLADGSLAKRGQRVRYEAKAERAGSRRLKLEWRAE